MRRHLAILLAAATVATAFGALAAIVASAPPAPSAESPPSAGPHFMRPDPDVSSAVPPPEPPGWTGTPPGTRGSRTRATGIDPVIIILIDFTDVAATTSSGQIDTLFNDAAPTARSAVNFYDEVSYGLFGLQGTVTVWVHSARTMAYYGGDGTNGYDSATGPIYRLTVEAVQLADGTVNFANFDRDGNGVVDHVIVVHAGDAQEANAGNPDLIWSHRWSVVDANPGAPGDQPLMADGKQVYGYIMVSELSPVGVYVHELGHDLGLPDLYDTDGSSDGIGVWDVMGSGSWNGSPRGTSPAHFSAWSKIELGWVVPTVVGGAILGTSIASAENASVAFKLPVRAASGGDEYFLVENREPVGFDARLPGRGLLIWHVDDSVPDNANEQHRLVDLEEADGNDKPTQSTDPWVSSVDGWGPDSTPNSNSYLNQRTGWKVRNISAAGGTMTADLSREVDDDLVILALNRPCCVPAPGSAAVNVTVGNRGARTQADVTVNLTAYRNAYNASSIVCCAAQTIPSMAQGATVNLSWTVPAASAGKYILEASVPLPLDEIPENNLMFAHFTAANYRLYDDVESGVQGWTTTGGIADPVRWEIIQDANGSESHTPTHAWKFGRFDPTLPCTPPLCPEFHDLVSAPVTVPAGPLYLYFWHRFDLRGRVELNGTQETDTAYVNISYGGPWIPLATFNLSQPEWRVFYWDLSPNVTAPATITLKLSASSDYLVNSGGWWVDDIALSPSPLTQGLVARPVDAVVAAEPGGYAVFRLKVANVGEWDEEVEFDLDLSQLPGWAAEVGANLTRMESYVSYRSTLRPDADATILLRYTVSGDAQRGRSYTVPVTAVSTRDVGISATFYTTTVISDPFGLAGLERYIFVFLVVFAVIIVIAVVIDAVKKQRGVYRRW